jgi:hypothetical protein
MQGQGEKKDNGIASYPAPGTRQHAFVFYLLPFFVGHLPEIFQERG